MTLNTDKKLKLYYSIKEVAQMLQASEFSIKCSEKKKDADETEYYALYEKIVLGGHLTSEELKRYKTLQAKKKNYELREEKSYE